ncbi:MAG: GTP 3',8-cyclase MoaA [Eubacteriales bacterium]|nr:GTP 3',8-cyclase MoaA [Eubacteriales bacterium]
MIDNCGRTIDYMRISVTDLCNLRCRYCMGEEGVCKKTHQEMMSAEEIVTAVKAAAGLGIRKIRITGGEPLVKRNIVSICRNIASVEGIEEVCMTTNGILLPDMAEELRAAGVTRLNLSLDTLDAERYAFITRRGDLQQFFDGLEAALSAGFDKIKINVVLIGGFNDDEIRPLAELTLKYPVDVRFIELMPMYDSGDFDEKAFIFSECVLQELPELEKAKQDGGVAKLYRLPGAKGNIGLISPISAHFCSSCNRIRLTADGKIKPCLHSSEEYSLKGMDLAGMKQVMELAVFHKPQWHGVLDAHNRSEAGRWMNQIGG